MGAQVPGGSQRQVGGGLVKRLTRLRAVSARNSPSGVGRYEPVR
nr:MAG TPA: hypothetical protein [Caudoviricetes sp.]